MKVIGLCGGSGSGKGTVAAMLAAYGIPSIDTDALYHRLTDAPSPCLDEIRENFGDGIVGPDGGLDRPALAKIVFAPDGAARRALLNSIAHRHILAACREEIGRFREEGRPAVLVDAPLLFESGFNRECDLILAVLADRTSRVRRIVSRDGIAEADALRRVDSQLSDEELAARADLVVRNDGDLSGLSARVAALLPQLLN